MSPTNLELIVIAVLILALNVVVAEVAPHIAKWFGRLHTGRRPHRVRRV